MRSSTSRSRLRTTRRSDRRPGSKSTAGRRRARRARLPPVHAGGSRGRLRPTTRQVRRSRSARSSHVTVHREPTRSGSRARTRSRYQTESGVPATDSAAPVGAGPHLGARRCDATGSRVSPPSPTRRRSPLRSADRRARLPGGTVGVGAVYQPYAWSCEASDDDRSARWPHSRPPDAGPVRRPTPASPPTSVRAPRNRPRAIRPRGRCGFPRSGFADLDRSRRGLGGRRFGRVLHSPHDVEPSRSPRSAYRMPSCRRGRSTAGSLDQRGRARRALGRAHRSASRLRPERRRFHRARRVRPAPAPRVASPHALRQCATGGLLRRRRARCSRSTIAVITTACRRSSSRRATRYDTTDRDKTLEPEDMHGATVRGVLSTDRTLLATLYRNPGRRRRARIRARPRPRTRLVVLRRPPAAVRDRGAGKRRDRAHTEQHRRRRRRTNRRGPRRSTSHRCTRPAACPSRSTTATAPLRPLRRSSPRRLASTTRS